MSLFDTIPVVSLNTPNPSRVHFMDEDGYVLCNNNHLRFCMADAHRGFHNGIPMCTPCSSVFNRKLKELRGA